jgi:hypothetical protein
MTAGGWVAPPHRLPPASTDAANSKLYAEANGVSFEGDTKILERLWVREEQLTAPLPK